MSDDEAKARELAETNPAQALVYALLDIKSALHSLRQTAAFANIHQNTWMRTIAQQEGRAVTLIRRTGTRAYMWRGEWHAGSTGGMKTHESADKENVLRWAANLPAGVRLILDPDTNDWVPWEDMEAEAYVTRDVDD
jgi:hypothetical protein